MEYENNVILCNSYKDALMKLEDNKNKFISLNISNKSLNLNDNTKILFTDISNIEDVLGKCIHSAVLNKENLSILEPLVIRMLSKFNNFKLVPPTVFLY